MKVLRRRVWERDKGICQICMKPVTDYDWALGHDKARSKGGQWTYSNTFVAHTSCNSSQGTLSLRQVHRVVGLTRPGNVVRKALKDLSVIQLRSLASKKGVKVRGSVSEGWFADERKAPSKSKYVNALAKIVSLEEVSAAKSLVAEKPKKRRKRERGLFDW